MKTRLWQFQFLHAPILIAPGADSIADTIKAHEKHLRTPAIEADQIANAQRRLSWVAEIFCALN